MKYHKAIPYYREAINIKQKNTLAIRTKLAYCYRMLNQMEDASWLYEGIVSDKKARAITYYYYGETLMSVGKYDEAKIWFRRYDELNPKDGRGLTMVEACEKAKTLSPIFPDITIRRMAFNSTGDDYAPMYYDDGLIFISDFEENKNSSNAYDWTGRAFSSILFAEADSAQEFVGDPLPFSRKFNKREKNSGPASISGNGKYMFFSRNNDETNSNGNKYTMAIFVAEKAVIGWKKPEILPICNLNFSFMHPTSTHTGDTIYFISDKPGGFGETDIYMTYRKEIRKRNKKGDLEIIEKWMLPTNLGSTVNSAEREAFPYLCDDGNLYFASKGHAGYGGFDIFQARPDNESGFQNAVNLGSNINSPKDDMSIIFSADKRTGYFSSNRMSSTDDDIFSFRKGHEQFVIKGEVMNNATRDYLKDAKVSLQAFDLKTMTFTDDNGNFNFVLKPGKEYTIKVTLRGYAPFEYPINATELKDGEVLPFLIQLRQLEDIPYAHIEYEQSLEEDEYEVNVYEPEAGLLNEEIDPYEYLPPSIPARGLVARNMKTVLIDKQVAYKKRKKIADEKAKREKTFKPKPQSIPEDSEDLKLAAKSSVKENLKVKTLKETAKQEKPAVKIVTSVRKKEKSKKVKNRPTTKPVTKPTAKPTAKPTTKPTAKPQPKVKKVKAEAEVDNTVEDLPQPNDLPEAETSGLMFMDLDIINEQNKPVTSVLIALSNEKGQLLRNYYTNLNGNVDLELKPNKTYMLRIEHDDFRSKTIMICTDGKTAKERMNRKVLMKENFKAKMLDIKPIRFEKGSLELGQLEQVELEKLVTALMANPKMTIKVSGYTDALGDEKYNFDLSKKRAMVVAKYLIKKGVEPSRMMPKGKGANELKIHCGVGVDCSDELHQENRRVEIKVLKF
jgi:outer membrane protein OmpA-like peptidoglycan-associated protein